MRTLGEMRIENQTKDLSGKPEYFSTTSYITMFQKEKALYQACNREVDGKNCQKKVRTRF